MHLQDWHIEYNSGDAEFVLAFNIDCIDKAVLGDLDELASVSNIQVNPYDVLAFVFDQYRKDSRYCRIGENAQSWCSRRYLPINPKLSENMRKRLHNRIDRVIFNSPATIVFWKDGTKTVAKAENEPFDAEKGFAMAVAKKFLTSKDYHRIMASAKDYRESVCIDNGGCQIEKGD